MVNAILYSEVSLVCILILMLLCIKVKNSTFVQSERIYFIWLCIANIVFFASDSIWIFADSKELQVSITFNWILNMIFYILSCAASYTWFLYSENIQDSKFIRDKKYKILATIPFVIVILLTITSFGTKLLFFIDENNEYVRGPLYLLHVGISYGYVVVTAVKALIKSKKTDQYRYKSTLKTLAKFVIPTIICGGFQVFFPGYPIVCVGNTVAVLYVYLTMQEQLVSVDALTKLNNRNQLFQFLSMKMSHNNSKKMMYLLIMDIDYFKSINDKYGHVEGDNALISVANALMKVSYNKDYFISRYGGDEFILICEVDDRSQVDEICNEIHRNLKDIKADYEVAMSIGYAKYTKEYAGQQQFIAAADKELYKVKQNRKIKR